MVVVRNRQRPFVWLLALMWFAAFGFLIWFGISVVWMEHVTLTLALVMCGILALLAYSCSVALEVDVRDDQQGFKEVRVRIRSIFGFFRRKTLKGVVHATVFHWNQLFSPEDAFLVAATMHDGSKRRVLQSNCFGVQEFGLARRDIEAIAAAINEGTVEVREVGEFPSGYLDREGTRRLATARTGPEGGTRGTA
jgi:hypothetical protein